MTRVTDLDDPNRCQAIGPRGQCQNQSLADSEFCHACIGFAGRSKSLKARQQNLYHLTQARLRNRIDELSGNSDAKSLRIEIAMTRSFLEELVNGFEADDKNKMLASFQTYIQLVQTIERLIKTAFQMEKSLGELLGKDQLIEIAQELINIMIDELQHIPDHEEIIDRINSRFLPAIESVASRAGENEQ